MKANLEPEIRTLNLNGTDISYLYYYGEGPTVVLLHATGLVPWLWHPISRSLAGAFKVVVPYFCDHRNCEPEDGGLHWQSLAEDVLALCDGLGVDRPFLAGHSMGATVATLAAAARPGWSRRMVLIEPIFLPSAFYGMKISVAQHPLASKSIHRRNHWVDAAEARSYLRKKPLFARWDEQMLDLYIRHGMTRAKDGGLELVCHPRQEASLFMGGVHLDPWPYFSRVDCPVLVVEGEKSTNRGQVDLEKTAEIFPLGSLRKWPTPGI